MLSQCRPGVLQHSSPAKQRYGLQVSYFILLLQGIGTETFLPKFFCYRPPPISSENRSDLAVKKFIRNALVSTTLLASLLL